MFNPNPQKTGPDQSEIDSQQARCAASDELREFVRAEQKELTERLFLLQFIWPWCDQMRPAVSRPTEAKP